MGRIRSIKPEFFTHEELVATSKFAAMGLPESEGGPVTSADDMMSCIVAGSDPQGRYYANPRLVAGLFWWCPVAAGQVREWLDELVARNEIRISQVGWCEYGGSLCDVLFIVNPRRFARFAPRRSIPKAVRCVVFSDAGHKCEWCGSDQGLSIDHIVPVSKGGGDDFENLQCLCMPCNLRKKDRDDATAKAEVLAGAVL